MFILLNSSGFDVSKFKFTTQPKHCRNVDPILKIMIHVANLRMWQERLLGLMQVSIRFYTGSKAVIFENELEER